MDQVHQVSAWRSRRQGAGQEHSRDPSAVLEGGLCFPGHPARMGGTKGPA